MHQRYHVTDIRPLFPLGGAGATARFATRRNRRGVERARAGVAQALMYAVQNGAEVVNMSFGGGDGSLLEQDAIDFTAAHGLVLVAAAGNDASDEAFYPGAYDPVIAVASRRAGCGAARPAVAACDSDSDGCSFDARRPSGSIRCIRDCGCAGRVLLAGRRIFPGMVWATEGVQGTGVLATGRHP